MMPMFSYQCPNCKVVEDKLFKTEERPEFIEKDCCICGVKDVRFERVLTKPSGFRLKGKGFYKKTSTFD